MAIFKKITNINGFYSYDYNETYEVTGKLTDADIDWTNNVKYKTVKLKFANTCNLDSYTVSRIHNDNVIFSIDGGDQRFKEARKEITSLALATVLYYFESIEQEIDPNWTQLQKAMYIHNIMCTDFKYTEKIDEDLSNNDLCRSLTGILYGQLTCAGFATVYKEFMDRLGITCYFEGVEYTHRYNILCIDGKYYGVDTTWDNTNNRGRKISLFNNFGTDERFYYHYGHIPGIYIPDENRISESTAKKVKEELGIDIPVHSLFNHYQDIFSFINNARSWDGLSDEEIIKQIQEKIIVKYSFDKSKEGKIFVPDFTTKRFPLSFLTRDEIDKNLSEIEQSLLNRKSKVFDLGLQDESTRKKYLPNVMDYDAEKIDKMPNHELDRIINIRPLFEMIKLLKEYGINDEKYKQFMDAYSGTYSIALDINPVAIDEVDIKGLKFERAYNYETRKQEYHYKGFDNAVDTEPLVFKAQSDIDEELTSYMMENIDYVIDNYDELMTKYNTPKDNEDDRYNTSMMKTIIFSYFQPFIYHEEVLINLGYRTSEVKEIAYKLKQAFREKLPSVEEIIANEKDFLYAAFEDMTEVKALLEEYENTPLSDEEFKIKLYDTNYLKQALNLSSYHLSDEDYHQLFDEIFKNQMNM